MSDPSTGAIVVRCGCCDGTGSRPLTRVEAATIAAVGTEWVKTADLLSQLRGVAHTALCNRLAALERVGLIESRPLPNPDGKPGQGQAKEWRRRGLRVRARSVLA